MTFDEYQKKALTTLLSTGDEFKDLAHFVSGLTAESGEVAGKLQKIIRDKEGEVSEQDKVEIAKELGDVLWYLSVLTHHIGFSFDDLAKQNIEKIKYRQKNNLIKGSGDNR